MRYRPAHSVETARSVPFQLSDCLSGAYIATAGGSDNFFKY